MSYSFNTELFGLTVLVTGEFTPEEPQELNYPGCPSEFEIESIEHEGEQFEVDSLPYSELKDIAKAAFESAAEEDQQY